MSEENNTPPAGSNGSSDVEKLQAKNGEIIGKNKELKEANTSLASKIQALEGTLSSLGKLVGVQDGEDITTKAQELIRAKEQEAFDKMSESEKLSHRIQEIESALTQSKLEKEKAESEALGLRIDSSLKSALTKNGVVDEAIDLALVGLKSKNDIRGLENENLLVGDSQSTISSVVEQFLQSNKYLVKNPSKSGSGFNGGSVEKGAEVKQALKQARESRNFSGVVSQMLQTQRGG